MRIRMCVRSLMFKHINSNRGALGIRFCCSYPRSRRSVGGTFHANRLHAFEQSQLQQPSRRLTSPLIPRGNRHVLPRCSPATGGHLQLPGWPSDVCRH